MKNRYLTFIPAAALAFITLPALAEIPEDFSEVDQNADGILSTAEAQQALPDLAITDMNGDGLVNPAEVEGVVPDLMIDSAEDKATAHVGESEYQLIVQAVQKSENLG